MNAETLNVVLLFLGAIVAAVLFIADRTNRRLGASIPADLMPLFLGLLALAETLAESTATEADDELIARIKAALQQDAPPPVPAEPVTPPPVDPDTLG